MKKLLGLLLFSAFALNLAPVLGTAGEEAMGPDVEGNWVFVKRVLPDGTEITPPAIKGLLTFHDGFRNFNLVVSGPDGKFWSLGYAAIYELSATEYRETALCYQLNDQLFGQGVKRDLSGPTASSPITHTDGKWSWKMPNNDEPMIEFSGDKAVAWMEGVFTDYWERAK